MLSDKSGIYRILNLINNKFYIGSAKNLKQRWQDHRKLLRSNKHPNSHLQAAWNKYGEENFKFEIIELVDDNTKLIEKEQYYIDLYDACNNKIAYNISPTAGSTLGVKYSDEARFNISFAKKGKPSGTKGIKRSKEANDKNSQTHIEMYKEKSNHPWFGRHHTQETIKKISEIRKVQGNPWNVKQFCKNGHDIFIHLRDAYGRCKDCRKTENRSRNL